MQKEWDINQLSIGMYIPRRCPTCNHKLFLAGIKKDNPSTEFIFKCEICKKEYIFQYRKNK